MKIRINRAKLIQYDLVNLDGTKCCPVGFIYRKVAKKKITDKHIPYNYLQKKFKVGSLWGIWGTNDNSSLTNSEKEERIIKFCKEKMGLDVEYYGKYE